MQARFNTLFNDLIWEIFDQETQKFIIWQGYNDQYWWDNVSTSDQFQVRDKYRLNPKTNEVTW